MIIMIIDINIYISIHNKIHKVNHILNIIIFNYTNLTHFAFFFPTFCINSPNSTLIHTI